MAQARRKAKRARGGKRPDARATEMRNLVNQAVGVQTELLSAAVQVWSTMFESLAAYSRAVSEEIVGFSANGDANASLDRVLIVAKQKLDRLQSLPEKIGRDFAGKVRARAKR
jgi:hypothetical protein